jgi:RHS repeat-associated protein
VGGEVYNPYQYTGEAWDAEVELLYLRARYYQPEVGRFVTKDPWTGDVWRPGTLNRYVYATNNPVNRIDPSGLNGLHPGPPTPTPTPTHYQIQREIEQRQRLIEAEWEKKFGEPYPVCTVPLPWTVITGEYSPIGEVRGILLHQRSVISPERSVNFLVLVAARAEPGQGLSTGARQGGAVWLMPLRVMSSLTAMISTYDNGTVIDAWDTYDTRGLLAGQSALNFPPEVRRSVAAMIPGARWDSWPESDFEPIAPPGQKGQGRARGLWFGANRARPTGLLMNLWLHNVGGIIYTFGWPWWGVASYTVPI